MSADAGARPAFAHASEAELARILDFYQVRWTYEPDTFPIGWSMSGEVVESFSPDFYLPDLDLYIELTTLKQKLVRKKNRKLRRLRELYPDVRIKLFYARDFRALLLKFGRLALLDDLSGTTGQATPAADRGPDRARGRVAAAAGARRGRRRPPPPTPTATIAPDPVVGRPPTTGPTRPPRRTGPSRRAAAAAAAAAAATPAEAAPGRDGRRRGDADDPAPRRDAPARRARPTGRAIIDPQP